LGPHYLEAQKKPWIVLDIDVVITYWPHIREIIETTKTDRFLILQAIVNELDFAKNVSDTASTARSIIRFLGNLDPHYGTLRLQKASESQELSPKNRVGSLKKHHHDFMKAILYFKNYESTNIVVVTNNDALKEILKGWKVPLKDISEIIDAGHK